MTNIYHAVNKIQQIVDKRWTEKELEIFNIK